MYCNGNGVSEPIFIKIRVVDVRWVVPLDVECPIAKIFRKNLQKKTEQQIKNIFNQNYKRFSRCQVGGLDVRLERSSVVDTRKILGSILLKAKNNSSDIP